MRLSDKQPYQKIWTQSGYVFVDMQIFHEFLRRDFEVRLLERDGYPWVFASDAPVAYLHKWVDNYYVLKGLLPPLPAGWEIHHANNKDKRDNRIRHLRRLPPDVHGRVTRNERRRYRRKKRDNVHGLYRPHMPGRVVGRPEMIGEERDLVEGGEDPRVRLSPREQEIEIQLWRQLDVLRRRARQEKPEGKALIPPEAEKKEWRTYALRKLLLKHTRRACTPGEAALVFALVLSGFDRDAASGLVGIPVWWTEKISKREPVAIAIRRWQEHRRYPKPCPDAVKRLVGASRMRAMRAASKQSASTLRTR